MYEPDHTIAAVSSAEGGARTLIRVSGAGAFGVVGEMLTEPAEKFTHGIIRNRLIVDGEMQIDVMLYVFVSPSSYTGDDLVEMHVNCNGPVTMRILDNLFERGVRLAEAGEFTARSYLNGKIDLSQAEAVGGIVASSNKYQLAAAEKLLGGRLTQATEKLRGDILEITALLEAGLDFTEQDIEFITPHEASARIAGIIDCLNELLAGSVSCEAAIDLPSVGLAGAANAGKSSLLNALLGSERSIVSDKEATTRDVLTGVIELGNSRCVLFDCAGLAGRSNGVLDELGREAAVSALNNSSANVFCVDISKADYSVDVEIKGLIKIWPAIFVATKSDLVSEKQHAEQLVKLNKIFNAEFLAVSSVIGSGIGELGERLDEVVCALAAGGGESAAGVGLTGRHKRSVGEAADYLAQAAEETELGNEEVAAMLLRAGWKCLSDIGQEAIDEKILSEIFGRFCVGK